MSVAAPISTFPKPFRHFMGERNLNLGCGRNLEPGFVNLDCSPNVGADLVWDLEMGLPAYRDKWDLVFASHCLEHVRNIVQLMRAIHSALKPGGHLIAVTPYLTSFDAWEDPTHVRAFSENSWIYFDRRTYEGQSHGNYDSGVDFILEMKQCILVPHEEYRQLDSSELEKIAKSRWNVIVEMHTILEAVK